MEKYDILVVGGSTTGSWFARKMAEKGYKVLMIEKEEKKNISRAYDIFHMSKKEMNQFGLEIPSPGDKEFGFTFEGSPVMSPFGAYAKSGKPATVVGLHKHEYILFMHEKAKKAGAKIACGAEFTELVFNENGKVKGAKYKTSKGAEKEVEAKLVADCTGIPAVARRQMPGSSTVENFKLTNRDVFFVVLYYVKYLDEKVRARDLDASFLNYKVWSAPSGDEHGAILGVGGNYGYDYAEEIFKTQFRKNVPWPEYTVEKVEKGLTPYHRGIYSFVDDGFIALGDTACLTKPTCGEGCTSSLVQCEIAVNVIDGLLRDGKALSRENMWPINCEYIKKQGIAFDSMRPLLMGVVSCSPEEAEYLFKKDIIFSRKILGNQGEDLDLSGKDIADIVAGIATGVVTGKIKPATVGAIAKGLLGMLEVTKLYEAYPAAADGYFEWKAKADALWNKIGSMADKCDEDILRKLGY